MRRGVYSRTAIAMPYRPRELVVRAREAAALLLTTLDHDEMVQRFLDIYAAETRRPGRADHPTHYREHLETIRREAILTMVLMIVMVLLVPSPQLTTAVKLEAVSEVLASLKVARVKLPVPLPSVALRALPAVAARAASPTVALTVAVVVLPPASLMVTVTT